MKTEDILLFDDQLTEDELLIKIAHDYCQQELT